VDISKPPVVLITGASRGIGRALALRLAADGARVALLARSSEGLQETLAAVTAAGGEGAAFSADVTDDRAVATAHAEIEGRLGPVDVLVNNAGVGGPVGEMWTLSADAWWQTVEVNLQGTYLCARAVLPGMVERRRGRIINIVSNAGAHRWPYFTAYAVSKGAVIKLTESLAAETRAYGVAVIAAHPGLVRGGLTDAALGDAPPPAPGALAARVRSWFERELEAGRTVSVDEAASFVAQLSSGRADALSGRYVAVEDDLDALIQHAEEVRRDNLHALKVQRLPARAVTARGGTPR
jgi:NAD(P)-dependent dehydrogenase (short-subunit alcohol dehydrogenase family)